MNEPPEWLEGWIRLGIGLFCCVVATVGAYVAVLIGFVLSTSQETRDACEGPGCGLILTGIALPLGLVVGSFASEKLVAYLTSRYDYGSAKGLACAGYGLTVLILCLIAVRL